MGMACESALFSHIFRSPAPGVAVGKTERGIDGRQPGAHGLIITETGRIDGMVGGNVAGIIFESDLLSLCKGQF